MIEGKKRRDRNKNKWSLETYSSNGWIFMSFNEWILAIIQMSIEKLGMYS